MRCFSCDESLPPNSPRDPKTNRFYCDKCRQVIDDLINRQPSDESDVVGTDVIHDLDEDLNQEIREWQERIKKETDYTP